MGDAMCLDCERPSGVPNGSRPALGRPTDADPSCGRQLHCGRLPGSIQVDQAASADSQEEHVALEER
eukprot:3603146-Alexandrium_andersonii.AAC.1